jgi:uncharacterized protein (DUF1778 family)
MAKQAARTDRLEARVHPDTLILVKRAAEIQGRSVSDFVIAAAEQAARQAIEDNQILRLSVEDQIRFAELLLNPLKLTPELERARTAHKNLIISSE